MQELEVLQPSNEDVYWIHLLGVALATLKGVSLAGVIIGMNLRLLINAIGYWEIVLFFLVITDLVSVTRKFSTVSISGNPYKDLLVPFLVKFDVY